MNSPCDAETDMPLDEDDLPLADLQQMIRQLDPAGSTTAADYLAIDNDAEIMEEVSDDNIIDSVTAADERDADNDQDDDNEISGEDKEPETVSVKNARSSLNTAIQYFESNGDVTVVDRLWDMLAGLSRPSATQSGMTDFFHPV